MTREALVSLDRELAFQTSARYDLLAATHVAYAELGAPDLEEQLGRAIAKAEGVIAVIGRIGAGKSSLISAVTSGLNEGFVPLRISVVGVEAGDPAAFARHAMLEIRDLPETRLAEHERRALARDTALARTAERRTELRAGFEIAAGEVFTPKILGDLQKIAAETLTHGVDAAEILAGLQRLLDAFWRLGRCPVLIVDDTDHWGGEPAAAEAFFDTTARTLGRLDAVTVVQAQTAYTQLDGYRRVRETFTAELHLPALPDPRAALVAILQRRIDGAGVQARVSDLFETGGLDLLRDAYLETAAGGRAGDVRHALVVARTALELAVEDELAERVGTGQVQEALARNPLSPGSALG
jgi:hypothetical protein